MEKLNYLKYHHFKLYKKMSFNRLLQPKLNPFGLIIYSPKEGRVSLKLFSDNFISQNELYKYKGKGTYCNSFNDLFISEEKDFWIINNSNFNVKRKKLPIDKKNHSLIFLPFSSGNGKVFVIGGNDKKTFYYDLKKNYFINWAETNELHNKPSLIKINDYLYIFDTLQQNNFCYERSSLDEGHKKWEKIIPNFDKKIISNFPSGNMAIALDSNGGVVFLGGDNIGLTNNAYIYDPKENKISLTLNGTNDNMSFCDKTFYKINKRYSVALPHYLNEVKEIAVIDKDEQSLIKVNIEFPSNDKNTSSYNYLFNQQNLNQNNNLMICNYYDNGQGNQNLNSQYNNNYTFSQSKIRNIQKTIEEPKEFGYYISTNSSAQTRMKAQNERIKMVPFSSKYIPIKIEKTEILHNLKENKNEIKQSNNEFDKNQEVIEEDKNQDKENNMNYNNVEMNFQLQNNANINENIELNNKEEIQNNMKNIEQSQDIKQPQEEQEIYQEGGNQEQINDEEINYHQIENENQNLSHQEAQEYDQNAQMNQSNENLENENEEEHFEQNEDNVNPEEYNEQIEDQEEKSQNQEQIQNEGNANDNHFVGNNNEQIEQQQIESNEINHQEQNEGEYIEAKNEDEIKNQNKLDFNNAQIQNQNEDDEHFTERGLPTSEEQHEIKNEIDENNQHISGEENNNEYQNYQEYHNEQDNHIQNNEENQVVSEENKIVGQDQEEGEDMQYQQQEGEEMYHQQEGEEMHQEGEEMYQEQEGEEEVQYQEGEEQMQCDGESEGQNGEEQENSVVENNVDNNEEQINDFNGEENIEGEEYEHGNEEEMNFQDENEQEVDNGQKKERDSLQKTLTQNVGENFEQIAEHPSNVYYNKDNFCDYKP